MKHIICILLGLFISTQTLYAVPTESEIKAILEKRINTEERGVGIVVGLIDKNGRTIVSHGTFTQGGNKPVDENTLFEIGSITKVYTTTLLMDLVNRGELKLDDPIAKHLPKSVTIPTRNDQQITLEHLATHTSGLPPLPSNMDMSDRSNPYAAFTVEQMYDFLSNHTLKQDIGQRSAYSNLGMGLLGHILALKAGTDYETFLTSQISKPLGLNSTAIVLSADLKKRLATGHNHDLEPVANWDLPTLAGAGAIRSTVKDQLTFLSANLGLHETPLNDILSQTHIKRQGVTPNGDIGLGWQILKRHAPPIIWHNGGTGGYRTFIGFDKTNGFGVAVLSNTGHSVDDIGFHLLNSKYKLSKPKAKRTEIELDAAILETYVGDYHFTPKVKFEITLEENQLFAKLTGQGMLEVYPESENKFFYKAVDAQLTFGKNDAGEVTHLILHQNNMDQRAIKKGMTVEDKRPVAELSTEVLDRYVGRYKLIIPGAFLTITREGTQLKAQMTGQPAIAIYPSSETAFYYKVVSATVDFHTDDAGKVTGLTIHQGGHDITGDKVE